MATIRKSRRINPNLNGRNTSNGRFKKKCYAWAHNSLNECSTFFDLKKRPMISSKDYQMLIHNGVVDKTAKFICQTCFLKSKPSLQSNEAENHEEMMDIESADSEGEGESNDSSLLYKCIDIGKDLHQCILSDVSDIGSVGSIKDLSNFNSLMWLAKRPVELIQLLSNICNIDVNTASTTKLIIISKIVELIYYCN